MAKKKGRKVAKKVSAQKKSSTSRKSGKKTAVPKKGLEPLHDQVVVRRLTDEEAGTKSPSGIIIPDTVSKEKPEQGIVVAVGPGKFNEDGDGRVPMSVHVGDRVLFSKYGYDEVNFGGKEYLVLAESNIRLIIND